MVLSALALLRFWRRTSYCQGYWNNKLDRLYPSLGITHRGGLSASILKRRAPFDHNPVTFGKESFLQTLLGFADGYTSNVNDVTNVSSQIPLAERELTPGVYLRRIKIETYRIIRRDVYPRPCVLRKMSSIVPEGRDVRK